MAKITANRQMIVARNYDELCSQAVQKVFFVSQKVIKEQGCFSMALSGGSTPQGVYSRMASPAYRDQFDWKNIHFFLGDERWVPADNPRSNYKMISDDLLKKTDIPLSNFHAVKTDTPDVQMSASLYEKELIKYFSLKPGEFPRFDLVLLGLGQDGHTASLFPNHPALDEDKHLVVSVEAAGIAEKRITLTLPVINHAHAVFFLVSGPEKAVVLKNVLEEKETRLLPAGRVNPDQGKVWWLVDQEAASLVMNQ